MKVETNPNYTIIKDTQNDLKSFVDKLLHEHKTFENQNLIIDLHLYDKLSITDIKLFTAISKAHQKLKKSFVLIAQNIDFNALPTNLVAVPSKQEAIDIIEMDEIERDLGF